MQDQRTIDFERGEQLGILRDARLPSVTMPDGGAVSGALLKSVLRTIDDHGRGRTCWVTQQTIAEECCIQRRQTQRAIWCLREALNVLIVERRTVSRTAKRTCNYYTIVWTELVLLCPTRALRRRGRPPDQCANTTDQCANTTDQCAITGAQKRFEAQQETPPPPTSPADRSSGLGEWRRVEEEILSLGIEDWNTPIVAARSRVTPDHVLRVLQHYRAADGAYGPGALHRRLARCHPSLAPEQGWPPPTAPTGPVASALKILAACRSHPAAAAMDGETFQRSFRAQLRLEGLEDCWQQALWRESLVGTLAR